MIPKTENRRNNFPLSETLIATYALKQPCRIFITFNQAYIVPSKYVVCLEVNKHFFQ